MISDLLARAIMDPQFGLELVEQCCLFGLLIVFFLYIFRRGIEWFRNIN